MYIIDSLFAMKSVLKNDGWCNYKCTLTSKGPKNMYTEVRSNFGFWL